MAAKKFDLYFLQEITFILLKTNFLHLNTQNVVSGIDLLSKTRLCESSLYLKAYFSKDFFALEKSNCIDIRESGGSAQSERC